MEADLDDARRSSSAACAWRSPSPTSPATRGSPRRQGDEEAVERRRALRRGASRHTLPDEARVIKTIGDEVMVVGTDPAALADWAVGFQALVAERAAAADRHPRRRGALPRRRLLRPRGQPRRAGRARAAGGEVLVTRAGRRRAPATPPRVRAHRRGAAQGLLRADRAVPRRARRRAERDATRGELASSAVRARAACSPPGAASSCCSPAGATRSACSTSRSRCAARAR